MAWPNVAKPCEKMGHKGLREGQRGSLSRQKATVKWGLRLDVVSNGQRLAHNSQYWPL
ncbi:hypothetical protein CCACVL1_14442 [Corchorus capsularis]|uniref:Uncharacterized protein n=1 Tax=Corchorus capsularis TaxID=210143 RepID=A0A1R3I6Y7_COCAP|nr:hypothetical protein CCACVL1_14442 [Corchorus capsularis]